MYKMLHICNYVGVFYFCFCSLIDIGGIMKDIIKELIEYNEEQRELLLTLDKEICDNQLSISQKNNKFYYSIANNSDDIFRIKDVKNQEIYDIANNNYQVKLSKVLEKRIEIIDRLINTLKKLDLISVYDNLHPGRKVKVNPIEASYEVMVDKWIKEEYVSLDYPVKLNLESKNGEFMRSKSELILADLFHDYNIKYKYEKRLVLQNNITYYPDFTFLGKDLKEIYWEHFGIMNDPIYINKFIYKMREYEKNNIKVGENLIITFESEGVPFNKSYAIYLIKKYLL